MATKRYRKSNKNREITYEDLKDLDFSNLTSEQLEQYGLGSWLKKNAGVIGTVAGAAIGTVIEAHLDKNLGPVATVLVNIGTLKGRIRIILVPEKYDPSLIHEKWGKRGIIKAIRNAKTLDELEKLI